MEFAQTDLASRFYTIIALIGVILGILAAMTKILWNISSKWTQTQLEIRRLKQQVNRIEARIGGRRKAD